MDILYLIIEGILALIIIVCLTIIEKEYNLQIRENINLRLMLLEEKLKINKEEK